MPSNNLFHLSVAKFFILVLERRHTERNDYFKMIRRQLFLYQEGRECLWIDLFWMLNAHACAQSLLTLIA